MHVLVPGRWTIQRGHELLERVEADVRDALPHSTVFTHIEPLEDPTSFDDTMLDRRGTPTAGHDPRPKAPSERRQRAPSDGDG